MNVIVKSKNRNGEAGAGNVTFGLALGGGGMKGWAHVGVLSVLDQYGLEPDIISGCSVGALIGAYKAYGYTIDEMKQFMREQKTSSLFSLRFDGLGLLSTEAFREYLVQHFGDCRFEDLKTPFSVICTDLETGREVVINRGTLVDALLASSAMPGIFSPVEIDGRLLVDGGLCNNVPVSVLVNMGARYTIAVRLHRDLTGLNAPPVKRKKAVDTTDRGVYFSMWTERLKNAFRGENSRLPNGLEVFGRAMEIVVSRLEGYRLQAYPPDVLISPDVSHVQTLSFSEEKEEIFSSGVKAAEAEAYNLERIAERIKAGTVS
jgi:NTE family protein